jgi:hypothetical protein
MVTSHVTLDRVEAALRRVPPERLADVLLFVQFLEYQASQGEREVQGATSEADTSEDEALWAAVEANRAYKAQHPDEMVLHESGVDFLEATKDL